MTRVRSVSEMTVTHSTSRGQLMLQSRSIDVMRVHDHALRSLIGSANFTDRAMARNVEVGAVIHDPAFSRRVLGQWNRAIRAGLVRRVRV